MIRSPPKFRFDEWPTANRCDDPVVNRPGQTDHRAPDRKESDDIYKRFDDFHDSLQGRLRGLRDLFPSLVVDRKDPSESAEIIF